MLLFEQPRVVYFKCVSFLSGVSQFYWGRNQWGEMNISCKVIYLSLCICIIYITIYTLTIYIYIFFIWTFLFDHNKKQIMHIYLSINKEDWKLFTLLCFLVLFLENNRLKEHNPFRMNVVPSLTSYLLKANKQQLFSHFRFTIRYHISLCLKLPSAQDRFCRIIIRYQMYLYMDIKYI